MKEKLSDEFLIISENYKIISEKIAKAALNSGRQPSDISFMAVTKTVDAERINHAISCGIKLIGENRVQELLSKKPNLLLENTEVHLIGHLQTNKVRQIIGEIGMVQSVDSVKLAKILSIQFQKISSVIPILLEVNIGNENSKTGFLYDEIIERCHEISEFRGINIRGLMTIPPFEASDKENCRFFSDMQKVFIDISDKKIHNVHMDVLSMGMSSDYERAILEGSNLVRVGSSLFGPRIY